MQNERFWCSDCRHSTRYEYYIRIRVCANLRVVATPIATARLLISTFFFRRRALRVNSWQLRAVALLYLSRYLIVRVTLVARYLFHKLFALEPTYVYIYI